MLKKINRIFKEKEGQSEIEIYTGISEVFGLDIKQIQEKKTFYEPRQY